MSAPMLIALPQGLNVSGVTMWGVRLANALASRGRRVGLVLHREPSGQRAVEMALDPRVRTFGARALPSFDDAHDLDEHTALYGFAMDELGGGGPVVVSPNLHERCYETCARLTRSHEIRLVGWQHSDIAYDRHLLTRFEGVLSGAVAVSNVIEGRLRAVLTGATISNIPYGVEVGEACPARTPASGRPLRLVYTGRIEHRQKRVMALVELSRELERRGISHELRVLGDGPASGAFDDASSACPSIVRAGAVGAGEVRAALAWADAFVLPSRYEGLSVSMLEALAGGCVPVVARVESGASQAIEAGVSGLIAEVGPDEDEQATGAALAAAIASVNERALARMSEAAWEMARERYSIERHVELVVDLIDNAASGARLVWEGDGGGTVPSEAGELMRQVLASLAGRRVAIHGVGRHTLELERAIRSSPAEVVAFTDDDRQRHGGELWGVPIVGPERVREAGATDVVISSWLHEEEIWARRGVYERQGLRVHRVYAMGSRESRVGRG